ncbi:unnamed protein product [Clavelina lepadiformis]|uniref:Nuclease HARBI1 n=1 Tax=Clavelina lepadiformis TaxID=159417 RepID=A0ABP0GCZ7_CLALP
MDCIEFIEHFIETPPRRNIKDRLNPFENFTEEQFRERFRFRKDSVLQLLGMISSDLEHGTNRNHCIPPILQLVTTLRFYAAGHFQRTEGDLIGIDQSSACRVIHRVTRAIATRHEQFIRFPSNQDLNNVKFHFKNIAQFPGVLGAIDCSHIPIKRPSGDNGELYRNRKGYF